METDAVARRRVVLAEKLHDSLEGSIPGGTPRHIYGRVEFPGKITAVIGMRRVGKTTYVHEQRRARLAAGVPRTSVPYVNFEDERLRGMEADELGFLLDEYGRRVTGGGGGPVIWCFDEPQVVPGFEQFLRRLLDTGDVRVFATGSSAALLSREIATALRGRAWAVPLFPFSFREFLMHYGESVPPRPAYEWTFDPANVSS